MNSNRLMLTVILVVIANANSENPFEPTPYQKITWKPKDALTWNFDRKNTASQSELSNAILTGLILAFITGFMQIR